MGQKWFTVFDPQTWGSWGAWEGLERYLRGSRKHLEGFGGFGRASDEPKSGNFCGSKMVAIFDPQTWGLGRVWKGI